MRPLAPLIISFHLAFGGTVPKPKPPDRWFSEDKAQHFFLSFALTNLSYGAARLIGFEDRPARLTAGVTTGAAGVGKEIYDHLSGGHFSLKDLVWDGAGIAAGLVVVSNAR